MTPSVFRYNLDPTGINPENLVLGEIHQMEHRAVRAIAPKHGAFFAKSLTVTDTVTGIPLTPGVQFYAAELYEMPSGRYGKEIDAVVLIVDPLVSDNVTITYQALGGEFSTSAEAIMNMINNLNIDGRPVAWGAIVGKPLEFVPARHLHDLGDTYGWEYVVHAVNRVESAILIGDVASHDSIYQYIDNANTKTDAALQQLRATLAAHSADFSNPHRVTAAQVGSYTYAQSDQLLTPVVNALQLHIADKANPHNTTAAQVGAFTKAEVTSLVSALDAKANAHIADKANPHNTTAAQINVFTKEESNANTATINASILAHTSNTNNPHNTTAAQVGAYSKPEAKLITDAISLALAQHASNANNPHNTTAAQVGAYTIAQSDQHFGELANSQATTANRLAQLIAAPDPFPQYLTPTEGYASYVNNGGGVGQTANKVRIGWSAIGKTKITIDTTDAGNIAMEAWTTDQINAAKSTAVNYAASIPSSYVGEAIYVRGIGNLEWVTTTSFGGYRCIEVGEPIYGSSYAPKAFELDMVGGLVPKAAYASLWGWALDNDYVVSEEAWNYDGGGINSRKFVFSDYNATHFRLPDMRNAFLRYTGWNNGSYVYRGIGQYRPGTLAMHTHTATTDYAGSHHHGTSWGESHTGTARYGIYSYSRSAGSGKTDWDNLDHATSMDGVHQHSVNISNTGDMETAPEHVLFAPRIHI